MGEQSEKSRKIAQLARSDCRFVGQPHPSDREPGAL